FGFFVALAFFGGYTIFTKETQRKEKEGLVKPYKRTVVIGEPASSMDLFLNGVLGFLVGYKLVYAFFNYSDLVQDPQSFLLSAKGNLFGGVVLAGLFVYWVYSEKKKQQLPKPKTVQEAILPHQLMGNVLV